MSLSSPFNWTVVGEKSSLHNTSGVVPPLLTSQNVTSQTSQETSAPSAPRPKPHFLEQMMPFVFVFLLFYFVLIRPAQKRQKKHQELVNQLKKGDSVITNSGILGVIYGLTESFITLEVADNVRIRVLRSQVSSLMDPNEIKQKKSDKVPSSSAVAEKKKRP